MSKTALVVDDSASMRQMVTYTLSSAGFTCHEAADGAEALRWLEGGTGRPDLVITDLNMPVMDGLSLIREIRARAENRFTPILMLTTESQDGKKQEGRAAGATGWLVKPFDPERLLGVVAKVVR
jgi:two-component system chemotaxis response regulator CheY